jgi:hypothetical protein
MAGSFFPPVFDGMSFQVAFEDVQRQALVVVIGPQFQFSAFLQSRGDYVFRRVFFLPSP